MGTLGPGHHQLTSNARHQSKPGCYPLVRSHNIRLHAKVLNGPPLTGSTHATLYFIGNQHDSIFIAQFTQCGEETIRRNDITAFALNGLDQNTSNLIPGDVVPKYLLFNKTDNGLTIIFAKFTMNDGAIIIRKWHMCYTRH